MKNIGIIIGAAIVSLLLWSNIMSVLLETDIYHVAVQSDACQFALDKEFPTSQPLIRRAFMVKRIGGGTLYLCEFQFGSDNNHPHIANVVWYDHNNNQVHFVQ